MDGSQDSLDAFHARLGVFTRRNGVSVKDLFRETLRRSTARRITPANPNVIESMMYGCRLAEVTTFVFMSDTMQVFCERLQAERAYVAEAYAVHMEAEVERLRLEAAAAAVAPPRPTAAHRQPAQVPQGPWPPVRGEKHGHRRRLRRRRLRRRCPRRRRPRRRCPRGTRRRRTSSARRPGGTRSTGAEAQNSLHTP